jgi:hypothetical protein
LLTEAVRDGWSVRDLKAQVMQCMSRVETIQEAVALIGHPEVNGYADGDLRE